MALTAKQIKFIDEYIKCPNATQAAKNAGYSEATAYAEGHKLKKKPEIAKAIEARFTESAMTSGEVLRLLAEQARADYAKYIIIDEGSKKPAVDVAQMIADGKAYLIKSIKYTRNGINVEFHSVEAAREMIFRGLGLDKGASLDEPQHTVTWTVDEWKAEQEKRRKQAAETEADFEDE